jgi:putative membrane protein
MTSFRAHLHVVIPIVGLVGLSACARNTAPATDLTARGTDGVTQTGTAGMQAGTGTIVGSGTTTDSRGGDGYGAFVIDNGVRGQTGGSGANTHASMDMRMRSDAEVVDIVHTSNTGEVQMGQLAVQRATDARVRQYAQRMIDEHTAADQRLTATGVTATSRDAMSTNFLQATEQTMTSLRAQNGAGFDRAYMDSQVQVHTYVLHNLDTVLIPSAKNADLRLVLQNMRTSVAEHLRQAQDLRRDVGGQ